MRVDERKFFQEATIRICGSLDLEKALFNWFMYIREFIPADRAYLHYYLKDLGFMKTFAAAGPDGGRRVDVHTAWTPEIRIMADMDRFPNEFLVGRANEHPLIKHMLKPLGRPENSSTTAIRLSIEKDWVGCVSLYADGWDRFNEEHLKLLSLLRAPFAVALSNGRRYEELRRLKELLADDNRYLREELRRMTGEEVIGADFGLKGVMEMARRVAPLNSPVLIHGETGTGKEVIAGAIHNMSRRCGGPLITVNCGAIPETLMDSELFGHEKGAFTGAVAARRGRFERADGGTIFLDEIGELPPGAQVRFLRVLQEKEIERLGSVEPLDVDIRVIAATHRDLRTMVREGRFREDLYFRLQVFPIAIPPLRKRRGDIPALVRHFIRKKSREMKLDDVFSLAPGAIDRLMAWHWPGNVRELENAVERALIQNRGEPLAFADFEPSTPEGVEPPSAPGAGKNLNLDLAIAGHIREVLKMTNGRVEGKGGAAELLGVNPGTLRHRMRKLGVAFGRNFVSRT